MSLGKRCALASPFILSAHLLLWPNGYFFLGLLVDMIGVTIIFNPWRRNAR